MESWKPLFSATQWCSRSIANLPTLTGMLTQSLAAWWCPLQKHNGLKSFMYFFNRDLVKTQHIRSFHKYLISSKLGFIAFSPQFEKITMILWKFFSVSLHFPFRNVIEARVTKKKGWVKFPMSHFTIHGEKSQSFFLS